MESEDGRVRDHLDPLGGVSAIGVYLTLFAGIGLVAAGASGWKKL